MHFKAKLVTWNDIEDWCDTLRDKIAGNYAPDVIIGLSRGGLVPARILSDKMWVKDLVAIKTEHWGITATKDGKAILKNDGKLDISNKKVLIVDDLTDTGESMKVAYDYVNSLGPGALKTATMLHISRSDFVPDFYADEVTEDNWAWFIFPWNVYEDLDNLIGRSLVGPENIEGIKSLLKRDYDLDTDSVNLVKVLADFNKSGRISINDGKYMR